MFDFLKSLDEAEPLPPIEIGSEFDPFINYEEDNYD